MKLLIENGLVIDPANGLHETKNVLVEDGKIAQVTDQSPAADRVIDAQGLVVAPGFIDIHMHEDPVKNGRLDLCIFRCMLSMGVTTAVGGNCGTNVCDPADYLDICDRRGAPVNVAMLAGHGWFRKMAGATDRYQAATPIQIVRMRSGINRSLERGCAGLSYGIRYTPGMDQRELYETAKLCVPFDAPIAAHIRDDAAYVFDAARELLEAGKAFGLPVELSHIGSMAGFGQMKEFLALVDEYRAGGLRVTCDCYPYDAYSTGIGETTYDDGWMERYGCDYSAIELCEGKYKGQRCTEAIFQELRRDFPECLTVCHVMDMADLSQAFTHPGVMLASDGTLNNGQGHPRAAGAFPRFWADFVRTGTVSMDDAIYRMSTEAAQTLGFSSKGHLSPGADGDVVIFDPDTFRDQATFAQPILPPVGVEYVLVNGQVALEKGQIQAEDLGRAVRRKL
jgi:N-acyl-D-amino-acid deacylase